MTTSQGPLHVNFTSKSRVAPLLDREPDKVGYVFLDLEEGVKRYVVADELLALGVGSTVNWLLNARTRRQIGGTEGHKVIGVHIHGTDRVYGDVPSTAVSRMVVA